MNPKQRGECTEAIVLAAMVKRGAVVLQPFGDNQRYDFVIDRGDRFIKLQCKTARLRDGAVYFSCTSTYQTYGMVKRRTHYRGQIDAFIAYCYENDAIYLVPIEEAGSSQCCLRVRPPANGQWSRVKVADRYLLDAQWHLLATREAPLTP